jgi:hypothetical protein
MSSRAVAAACLAAVSLGPPAAAQVTECVSINALGEVGNGQSSFYEPSISGDGLFVVYASFASNLVPGDTNGAWDVFVRDRAAGVTLRVSVDSFGAQGNGNSGGSFLLQQNTVDIAAGGRFVTFMSDATNLVADDTNGRPDVFVHDLLTGATTLESRDSAGNLGNGDSTWPVISADGRFVAFLSAATNLVPGDTNGQFDIFYRDRLAGTTQRVSVSSSGVQGNGGCSHTAISQDGRAVGFSSDATNLVFNDTNGQTDVFVHSIGNGLTSRVSSGPGGQQGFGGSYMGDFSGNGRFVAFSSTATFVSDDTNGVSDDYMKDRRTGNIIRVSVGTGGFQANDASYGISLSGDGRYVVFSGYASNLVPGDSNGNQDVFLRDLLMGTTTLLSVSTAGEQGNGENAYAEVSNDGMDTVFVSTGDNLYPGDDNFVHDVFVRDLGAP